MKMSKKSMSMTKKPMMSEKKGKMMDKKSSKKMSYTDMKEKMMKKRGMM